MTYKAVLFDLDGTLLDTLEDISDSMNEVLGKRGYPQHNINDYRIFIGNGLRNLVKRSLAGSTSDDAIIDHCLYEMKQVYSGRWSIKTHPYEGIPELLKYLSDKGIKLAVLSNKADEFTKLMISKFFPQICFTAVFGERQSVPRKPDPSGALEITQIAGVSPAEFVYLGDSGVDMETAGAAGMFPVGVLWGFRDREELIQKGAQLLLKEPDELMKII